MMPKQLDSRDDAVLTERKPSHPMIAGRTQPARALIALNHRRILSMVATVHHFLNLSPTHLTDCSGRRSPVCCRTSLSADPLPDSVPDVPRAFVPAGQ